MVLSGYVESVDSLPARGDQKPLNCIMLDGLPIMAASDVPLPFSVGDKVDIAVRWSGKSVALATGDNRIFRTCWFSALVSAQSPATNGNGHK